jgi:ADP-ribose pyrophosphatase
MTLFRFHNKDVNLIDKSTCYQGFFRVDEYRISHKLFAGDDSSVLTREMFERGDAVVLMPYDPVSDSVVLLEQFRVGALNREYSPWLLEFVAGMFAQHEHAIEVAMREAREEAGINISAEQIRPIMQYLSSPGGTTEQIHLYLAIVDSNRVSGVHGLDDEGEDILVHVLPRVQAMALLAEGKINNAATIIGLQWLALHVQQLRAEWQASISS